MCKRMAISYWALRYNPNKAYHEGVRKRVHEVLAFISAYISEIEKLEDIAVLIQNPKIIKWE